ncbi:unnamed protein product [Cyprideis torosa]|uniref:Uncharacterized protein n=1 Tax=Cyprideis torosa TaxID=163714 RepID=A0A7R8WBL5_9CRUS|nr:unnamed protein product [Cyprideis torosa]CAG0892430.1 unnamed protein product [Cyprideis torosa]
MFSKISSVIEHAANVLAPPPSSEQDLRYHWNFINNYFTKRKATDLKDAVEVTGIPQHLDRICKLLVSEVQASVESAESEDCNVSVGPCVEAALELRIIDSLAALARGDSPLGIRGVILDFSATLVAEFPACFIPQGAISVPFKHLVVLCGERSASPYESVEARFLRAVCKKTHRYPHLLTCFCDVDQTPLSLARSLSTLLESQDHNIGISAADSFLLLLSCLKSVEGEPKDKGDTSNGRVTQASGDVATQPSAINNVGKILARKVLHAFERLPLKQILPQDLDDISTSWESESVQPAVRPSAFTAPQSPVKKRIFSFFAWLDLIDLAVTTAPARISEEIAEDFRTVFLQASLSGVTSASPSLSGVLTASPSEAWSSRVVTASASPTKQGSPSRRAAPLPPGYPISSELLNIAVLGRIWLQLSSSHLMKEFTVWFYQTPLSARSPLISSFAQSDKGPAGVDTVSSETPAPTVCTAFRRNLEAAACSTSEEAKGREAVLIETLRFFEIALENPYPPFLRGLLPPLPGSSATATSPGAPFEEDDVEGCLEARINSLIAIVPVGLRSGQPGEGYDQYVQDAERQWNAMSSVLDSENIALLLSSAASAAVDRQDGDGCWLLDALFDLLQNMLQQSYEANLQLTCVLSRLALLPVDISGIESALLWGRPSRPSPPNSEHGAPQDSPAPRRCLPDVLRQLALQIETATSSLPNLQESLAQMRRALIGDAEEPTGAGDNQ